MRPLTFSTNKHFIPLANKPLLFYAIEEIVEAGIKEIGVNYNPGQLEEIVSYLGDGKKWGVRFTFILQEKPAGLANIVQVSRNFLGKDKFVMHLGDNIFYGGIKPLVKKFASSKANGLLTLIHHSENCRMGVPYFDKKGKVVRLVEKPKNPPHDWAIPGIYFADHHIFECFKGKDAIAPSARGEYEIPAAFQWLIDHGYKVETQEFKGVWLDPGKFDDWIETNRFLLEKSLNKAKVGKNCQIKNSVLHGPTIIGDGVVIRDSVIGPYCSIQAGCQVIKAKLENSILMKGVRLENIKQKIENSLIGEGAVIEGNHRPREISLFIGNQSSLKL